MSIMRTVRIVPAARWLYGASLLLAAMICTGCASQPGKSTATADSGAKKTIYIQTSPDPHREDNQKLFRQAAAMLRTNDAAKAIQGPIAQILVQFPDKTEDAKTRYYSAATPAEALLYASMGAQKDQNTNVMSGDWSQALFMMGFAYNGMGMYDAAQDALEKAARLSPMHAHYLNELGFTYEKKKRWDEAMKAFKSAETASAFVDDPHTKTEEQCRALRGQGYVLVELGELDEAEAVYHRALELDPDDTRSMGELQYIRQLRARK